MPTTNRLATETSLYLKQHANNPVDWFPWGPEALAKARELDRPIFLSIGYSACHWCHVMEHESFEDEATAKVMNEHFICIKVDREERPDLDTIYMNALQVLTQEGGGWPLSVFLSPDTTPFYAGTYYPPDDRYAPHRPSFRRLLGLIADAWKNRREQITEVGQKVANFLENNGKLEAGAQPPGTELFAGAVKVLRRIYDTTHGGFGTAPKFPHALELGLLLRVARRDADGIPLQIARHTLEQMARGGMYDQIGGGFHRYSTDAQWLIPHFEKMLYDNALLTTANVEMWQQTGDPFFRQIASETLDYVLREMTSPPGAFYSTQDADSEGVEGKFYVWGADELTAILGPELGAFACQVWGATPRGNFEGHNILFRSRSDADDAKQAGLPVPEFQAKIEEAKQKLYAARSQRVWPGRDEKILTAWNGMMISAFARAGAAFAEPRYCQAATRAAEYLLQYHRDGSGRLLRTSGVGEPAKLLGYLEDYAILADALITLYETTFTAKYLRAAVELADAMLQHFADPAGPGFFFTADDHEQLIARTKDLHDGSTPCGNAMAVTAMLRLAKLCDRRDFAAKAEEALRGAHSTMQEQPTASGQMLNALDFHLGPVQEIVIVGHTADPALATVLSAIRTRFRPNQVMAFHDPTAGEPPADLAMLFRDRPAVNGSVTVYVCENSTCQAPLVGVDAIVAAFGEPKRQ